MSNDVQSHSPSTFVNLMLMPTCRFENHLQRTALALEGYVTRLAITDAASLLPVLQKIGEYQAQGYWVALLLDYELGHWLEPVLTAPPAHLTNTSPRLVAHVFHHARQTTPWQPKTCADARIIQMTPQITKARYLDDVRKIQHLIDEGSVYQINYTFNMQVEISGDTKTLYRKIAHHHPSAYSAYIEDEQRTVLCFSPELFMHRQGNVLTCRPMKGTAPRYKEDADQDAHSGQQLQFSSKNRAENLMIVDLMRNDLHRIAIPGSVEVPQLFSLEAYPSVWALTSTIRAQLPQTVGLHELLRALFPCGSITGAPKIAAMKYIQQLEARSRGLYCGSIGWLAPNGDFALNIAIRSLILQGTQYGSYPVGSGIVCDSNPELEWEECFWKARVLHT